MKSTSSESYPGKTHYEIEDLMQIYGSYQNNGFYKVQQSVNSQGQNQKDRGAAISLSTFVKFLY